MALVILTENQAIAANRDLGGHIATAYFKVTRDSSGYYDLHAPICLTMGERGRTMMITNFPEFEDQLTSTVNSGEFVLLDVETCNDQAINCSSSCKITKVHNVG
jgi:hypothetical protein